MIWLATLLLGMGAGDLARPRLTRAAPAVSLLIALAGAFAGGAHGVVTWAGCLTLAALAAFLTHRDHDGAGDGETRLSLAVLGGGVVAALALAAVPHASGGVLERWWAQTHPGHPHGHGSVWILLHVALVLVQVSTGNRIVRQVLAVTTAEAPPGTSPLKGGRLLGPMERLIIVGLGLAGQPTAASVVIAAKGLLRFPELQSSHRRRRDRDDAWGIHQVTEYFLVGSFVSWSVALGALALATLG